MKIEARIPTEVSQELEARGHVVEVLEDYTDVMGHAGAIKIDQESGIKFGGADPRGDGAALGY